MLAPVLLDEERKDGPNRNGTVKFIKYNGLWEMSCSSGPVLDFRSDHEQEALPLMGFS